ncbi:MAG: NAD(P)/FAD-dependent oxidoreductase [Gammaproteobacteria bacterium]
MQETDCVIVGASFAGLACAAALARAGHRVTVLEKRADVGGKLHTTGVIVKDAVDQVSLLDGLPEPIIHRIPGVRLYAPNLRCVDLHAPGYYFLATNTPAVMRWLAARVEDAGAEIRCNATFTCARRIASGFEIDGVGPARYLVGADGPHSIVAREFGLGMSGQFLFGIEYEYAGRAIPDPTKLHCFLDRRIAPGYIGWMLASPTGAQVGLAYRMRGTVGPPDAAMDAFLKKLAPILDLRGSEPTSVRAGKIPCGGLVRPLAARRLLLVGDAAGLVSPVTAGGIHTALKHGLAAGHAVSDFLAGRRGDPSGWFPASYPKFRAKRLLRWVFDRFQSDTLANLFIGTDLLRRAAGIVYFHRRGVFDEHGSDRHAGQLPVRGDSIRG